MYHKLNIRIKSRVKLFFFINNNGAEFMHLINKLVVEFVDKNISIQMNFIKKNNFLGLFN